jgi:sulfatase modifying factor 1
MKATAAVAFLLLGLCWASTISAVTLDVVTVGNPGNAPDTHYDATGFGLVGYVYQLGEYEVTAGQYTEFLNAVADADPNGLYNTAMGVPGGLLGANIQQTGSSPNYSYSVAADWANRPVNYVSFWDAARFANWLDNGQPTGPQGPGTTENGAYHDVDNQTLFGRNAGAKFFIPTEDEWYKAAYHDKNAGLAATYFDSPMGTNTEPGNDISEATNPGNNANYRKNNYTIGPPYYRTVVGEFELSDSPYGTFDQGGNVWEWNETAVTGSSRGLRGGSCYEYWNPIRNNSDPTSEGYDVGFRVAGVIPEPSTLVLGGLASFGVLVSRRRQGFSNGENL